MPTARVEMRTQEEGQWCWAAVALSLADFFNKPTPAEQCVFVSAVLDAGAFDCCELRKEPVCDRQFPLEIALEKALLQVHGPIEPVPFEQVLAELDAQRPVAIGIDIGGTGHFAVIDSCDPQTRLVEIQDPLHGSSEPLDFDSLRTSYRGIGPWVTTYLTAG